MKTTNSKKNILSKILLGVLVVLSVVAVVVFGKNINKEEPVSSEKTCSTVVRKVDFEFKSIAK